MAGKQKIKRRKYEAILAFTVTILFSFLIVVLSAQAVEMGEIHSGETKSGNIVIAGQTDSFTFNGKEGQGVVIKAVDINDSDFTPRISLFKPDNSEEKNSWSSTVASIENYQLQQTGTYAIVIQDWSSGTGEYTLSLTLIGENGGKINRDEIEIIKNEGDDKIFCEDSQVIFQGKCVEISSLFRKDEEKISKEEYKSIIEKFDILKKEDKEKLEKLAAYLEKEIQIYLDNREYEEAKTNTSLLEITYYQLEDENKVDETKKKYEEIKKAHFIYKLTHPFNDPLEVFSTIIFDIILSSFYVIKKFRKEKTSLFKFIIKYWHKLIAVLLAFFIILWAAISIVLTMLK